MKIYLAGSMNAREVLRGRVPLLENAGHEVTSRWVNTPCTADMDLEDIIRSDLVAVFVDWQSTGGGYWVEMGVAFGLRIDVAIIGGTDNFFKGLADRFFYNWADFLNFCT